MLTFRRTKDMKYAGANSLNKSPKRGAEMHREHEEESKRLLIEKVKLYQHSIHPPMHLQQKQLRRWIKE